MPDPDVNSVLARVIGRANRPFLQTMILDAGAPDNAKPGEAVVDARGMIGRIYLTGDHTSWVILLTDLNSRIPVTIAPRQSSRRSWRATTPPCPALDTLSHTVILHAGDQVVSSGDGGLVAAGPSHRHRGRDRPGGYRVALLADAASSPGCRDPGLPPSRPKSCPRIAKASFPP